jgi:hypothetical protein
MPSPQSGENPGSPAFPSRHLPGRRAAAATAQIIQYRASPLSLDDDHTIKLALGLHQRRPQPRPSACPAWRRSPGAVQERLIPAMSGLAGRHTSPGANRLVEASTPTTPPTCAAAAYVGAPSPLRHVRIECTAHTRPIASRLVRVGILPLVLSLARLPHPCRGPKRVKA